jgi:hypothetical protein
MGLPHNGQTGLEVLFFFAQGIHPFLENTLTARLGKENIPAKGQAIMTRVTILALLLVCATAWGGKSAAGVERRLMKLEYAPAPVDNPLKGLVPYWGDRTNRFPHSMEFNYLPFSALVKDDDAYDWEPLESLLAAAAARGHQAVFRVYLEFPGKPGAIPPNLVKKGLKVHRWLNTNTQPAPPTEVETPDYGDPRLRKAMTNFIAAMGRAYDGDPRIGFISAGLLGTWGEWHDYPRDDLFAGTDTQAAVMDAYQASFSNTPVLLRYPVGPGNGLKASNADRPFGYHDDSFAWATLETGRKEHGWHFMALLRTAGPAAMDKWKTRPIGGEIRPEAWGLVFDPSPADSRIQDFGACVEATHATWLMDSGLFNQPPSPERVKRAEALVRRMGYEFHVPAAALGPSTGGVCEVEVEIENRGVAPLYHDWPAEFGLLAPNGGVAGRFACSGKLIGLLPGDKPRVWRERLDLRGIDPGSYRLALRVPNPLQKGNPIRFANRAQDRDAPGWLTLGEVVIGP